MILDNIKHQKAFLTRLKRMFKIVNIQAAKALLESYSIIAI
jgi:hypothetical protein